MIEKVVRYQIMNEEVTKEVEEVTKEVEELSEEHSISVEEITNEEAPKTGRFKGFFIKAKGNVNQFAHQAANDVQQKAGDAVAAINDGAGKLAEKAKEVKREIDLKNYSPVFYEDYMSNSFEMPALVRIIESDPKHEAAEVCQGSIGFIDDLKGLRVLNLYKKEYNRLVSKIIGDAKISFYPYFDEDFFHVHPYNKYTFINMNDYFEETKEERIAELQKIAYDLGAKRVTINYLEEKKALTGNKIKAGGKAKVGKDGGNGEVKIEEATKDKYTFSQDIIESYAGSDEPKMPKLIYFQNDSSIKNLVEMRINGPHSVHHVEKVVKYATSNGIKKSEALKIDAAFQHYKLEGNASVCSEVEQENRMMLKYQIDF